MLRVDRPLGTKQRPFFSFSSTSSVRQKCALWHWHAKEQVLASSALPAQAANLPLAANAVNLLATARGNEQMCVHDEL